MTLITYGTASVCGNVVFWRRLPEFKRQPVWLSVIALANGWTNVAFIVAVIDGTVVRVILLFYLSPLWTSLLGWLVLGERLSRLGAFTLCVAMSGALTMLWNPAVGFPWPQDSADWLAISSGLAFSLTNVSTRKLQSVCVRVKTLVSWFGVASLALLWILTKESGLPDTQSSVLLWTLLLGSSMVVIMTVAVQYGVTHMPVYRSAVILLFELVVATLSSQWLGDDVIEPLEWVGGALILSSAYLSARSLMKISGYQLPVQQSMADK